MTFLFNQTKVDSLAAFIAGKTWYVELVTAIPTAANTTVANLSRVAGGTYTLQPVSLGSAVADGSGARVGLVLPGTSTATNQINWAGLTASSATNAVGTVLVQQLGANPATSDRVVAFWLNTTPSTVANCATTNNRATVTTTNSFSGFSIGQSVSGTGISVGTRILDIPSATQLVLNRVASASGTGSITIDIPSNIPIPATLGGDVRILTPANGALRLD